MEATLCKWAIWSNCRMPNTHHGDAVMLTRDQIFAIQRASDLMRLRATIELRASAADYDAGQMGRGGGETGKVLHTGIHEQELDPADCAASA